MNRVNTVNESLSIFCSNGFNSDVGQLNAIRPKAIYKDKVKFLQTTYYLFYLPLA